jgi:signal transduction histidine kinase/ActR/RegA family two-component response regulator
VGALRRRLGLYFLVAVLVPLAIGMLLVERVVEGQLPVSVPRADVRGWFIMAMGVGTLVALAVSTIAARLFSAPLVTQSKAMVDAGVRERTKQLEEAQGELEERSRRGEEVDRLKSVFITNMSHEIRTPLNSVLALSQLLRDQVAGPLTTDQRNYLEVIERNGQNLLRLINDILDLSRIEAGHLEMDLQDIDLGSQVGTIAGALSPLAMAKDIDLMVNLPDDLPLVRCDVDRVRQILTNLIGNAIKFTDTGTVQVSAEARQGEVAIHVRDTGIGIPQGYLDKIFQEFVQVDQTLARRQAGTGLGLAIASRLARLMGGNITVSSIVGSGSRFTLTLPRTVSDATAAPKAASTVKRAGPPAESDTGPEPLGLPLGQPRPSVLIVEDNEDNLFTLRQVLAGFPLDIATASTGRQAIESCRRELPSLVIMDVQMPGMSGLQATGAIRALPGGGSVPILALTAQAMKGDRERILAAGCDEYLAKPVRPKELRDIVQRLLRRAAGPAGAATPAPSAPVPTDEKRR